MNLKSKKLNIFLSKKKIGLVLRVYASKKEQIPERVLMIQQFIKRALSIKNNRQLIISRIDILVWADKRYSESDCGQTIKVLKKTIRERKNVVFIQEIKQGDLFCGILNYGIGLQLKSGIDYSIIASSEAYNYFNEATLFSILNAANQGALAIGLIINELKNSIQAGRFTNTFTMWHNISLISIGGFDLKAAMPMKKNLISQLQKKDNFYNYSVGVEEVIPLVRMIENFGPCLAPILPQDKKNQKYIIPDIKKTPKLLKRHNSKMKTKEKRQADLLNSIGYNLSYLKQGIIPKYRD